MSCLDRIRSNSDKDESGERKYRDSTVVLSSMKYRLSVILLLSSSPFSQLAQNKAKVKVENQGNKLNELVYRSTYSVTTA